MTLTAAAVMILALVGLLQARQSLGDGAGQMFDTLSGSGETVEPHEGSAGVMGQEAALVAPENQALVAREGSGSAVVIEDHADAPAEGSASGE